MSSRPSPLISYAQNGEDIVLARALKPWERKGFWVDCGAGHPKYDSVTKLFSQFGWTGINIEPLDEEFTLLTQDRPVDVNIQCLLGEQEGVGSIFAGPAENRGSSTTDPKHIERYTKDFGQTFKEARVPVRRLDEILRTTSCPTIDFLKIDVEGAELSVLLGIDLTEFNPRVLVIEATQPNSTEVAFLQWEDRVLSSGYLCALFDGLNRFYVKKDDSELLSLLLAPANVLDDYETILHFELNQITANTQKTIGTYIEQFRSVQQYAGSLEIELRKHELNIADHKQQVIDAESRNTVLKTANEALEKQLIKMHDVKRQLDTIRSYKLFKLLSLSKKVIRKVTGRK